MNQRPPQGRYELKFPIPLSDATRFLEGSLGALEKDPHAGEGGYRVSSLYFDSPDLRAYWEKLDGEANRRKFRLRYYSPIDANGEDLISDGSVKMEIKHRLHNRVFKERVNLTAEGAEALLAGEIPISELEQCLSSSNPETAKVTESIVRASLAQDLEPVNLITYVREPWIGKQDPRMRVTIDSRLRAYRPGQHFDVASETGALMIPDTGSILEVKFDHGIPRDLRDRLQTSGIRLRRFSKYAAGLETPEFRLRDPGLVAVSETEKAQHRVFEAIDESLASARVDGGRRPERARG